MSSKSEGNNGDAVPIMPSPSKASNTQRTKQKTPKMMKGGVLDRPWFSWLRILLVTLMWWGFVFGFFSLCYFLTYEILYGSNENQPYFVRNFAKYPGVFVQPGLHIEWNKDDARSKLVFQIGINKVYDWKPETYKENDNPEIEGLGRKINMKEDLKEMNYSSKLIDRLVYVTCSGKNKDDVAELKGMKVLTRPGFKIKLFPIPYYAFGTKKKWGMKPVKIDLADTEVVNDKTDKKTKVIMECRLWSKNVDLAVRQVDEQVPNGGALAILCFCQGRIIKTNEEAFDGCS